MNKDVNGHNIQNGDFVNTTVENFINNGQNINGIHIQSLQNNVIFSLNQLENKPSIMTNGFTPIVAPAGVVTVNSNEVLLQKEFKTSESADSKQGLLHQMIINDVNQPAKSLNAINPRKTHVKHGQGGSVQITYKKMINNTTSIPPAKKFKEVYILPKIAPCTTTSITYNHTNFQAHVNYSNAQTCNTYSNSQIYKSSAHIQQNSVNSSIQYTSLCNTNGDISFNDDNTTSLNNSLQVSDSIFLHSEYSKKPDSSEMLSLTNTNNFTSVIPEKENLVLSFPKMTRSLSIPRTSSLSTDSVISTSESNVNNTQIVSSDLNHLSSTSSMSIANTVPDLNNVPLNTSTSNKSLDNIVDSNILNTFDINDFDTDMFLINQNNELPLSEFDEIARSKSVSPGIFEHCNFKQRQESLLEENHSFDLRTDICFNNSSSLDINMEEPVNVLTDVIDVSPEIASTTGGNKIILIGSWNAKNARYSCQFGKCIVMAELIQNGVLKCYSPKHNPEKVLLHVLSNGKVISKPYTFEFVDPREPINDATIKKHDWLSINNESLCNTLKERVFAIAEIISVDKEFTNIKIDINDAFEEQLVNICTSLMKIPVHVSFDYKVDNAMTLLHLSAALGYVKLIQLFLQWVETYPNKIICVEACPTSEDEFCLLPIMWSAAKGHFNTTCVLLQWNETTIQKRDSCGCSTIDLARECDHGSLVVYMERILKKLNNSRGNEAPVDPPVAKVALIDQQSNHYSSSSSPRTLGQTLAHIQSMLNVQGDHNEKEDESDQDESCVFESSFISRKNTELCTTATRLLLDPESPSDPPLNSPFNRQMRETAEFCEFFYRSKKIEKDFAELTLTDKEQAELYYAANVIQTAYKIYKERRQRREQEFSAAVLIQKYYRRYKQYAAFKKMQKGAVVIQNQYRAHREKSKRKCQAASLIQNSFRRYRERKCQETHNNHTRMQHQAERKTNRYLHQTAKRFSQEIPDSFLIETSTTADAFLTTSITDAIKNDVNLSIA